MLKLKNKIRLCPINIFFSYCENRIKLYRYRLNKSMQYFKNKIVTNFLPNTSVLFQFRQSIKRIFGIHSWGRNSQTDRRYNVTVTSPAHKLTSVNDVSKSNPDSSSYVKRRDKKITICDETSEIHNEVYRPAKSMELCTIVENKTGSDAERSGETIFDEDSSNDDNNKYSDSKLPSDHSPTLTILDTERTQFIKGTQRKGNDDILNIYGNQAYEDDSTDAFLRTDEKKLKIRHSFSLDLIGAPKDNKRRKMSDDPKHETAIRMKGLVDNIIEL